MNGSNKPSNFTVGSKKKVFWSCEMNHTYLQTIQKKCLGHGCPFCSGHKVDESNSLANIKKEIAKEWHPSLNGHLTPKDVTINSNKVIYWQCQKYENHVFKVSVNDRNKSNSGCPFCSNRKTSVEKSLQFVQKEICEEWDYDSNSIKPSEVVPGSSLRAWWLCKNGHKEYEQIRYRVRRGSVQM
jgi:hypothetical protein